MSPPSANSYDILAVYRLESLSECVVRVHARCSFACDPSGGSILEHPLGRPDLRRCPPSHLTSSFDGEGICSVLSVCEAIPRGNKCSRQFKFLEGHHNLSWSVPVLNWIIWRGVGIVCNVFECASFYASV